MWEQGPAGGPYATFPASSQTLAWLRGRNLSGVIIHRFWVGGHPKGGARYVTVQNRAFNSLLLPQLRNLLLDPAPHKLLVLSGPCLEETGELLLQTGGFSPCHFLQVLGDKEVSCPLPILLPSFCGSGNLLSP